MKNQKIKIPDALYERLKALAKEKGYSSAEEMVLHILEKAVDGASADCSAPRLPCEVIRTKQGRDADSSVVSAEKDSIKRQLKGLGYFNG